MEEVNTGGGSAVGGNVELQQGGDFVNRDSNRIGSTGNVIDINIPRESYDHLVALRQQIDRLETHLNWKLALFERDLEQNRRDLLSLRTDLMQMKAEGIFAKLLPQPEKIATKAEPLSPLLFIAILVVTFLLSIGIAFLLFYVLAK